MRPEPRASSTTCGDWRLPRLRMFSTVLSVASVVVRLLNSVATPSTSASVFLMASTGSSNRATTARPGAATWSAKRRSRPSNSRACSSTMPSPTWSTSPSTSGCCHSILFDAPGQAQSAGGGQRSVTVAHEGLLRVGADVLVHTGIRRPSSCSTAVRGVSAVTNVPGHHNHTPPVTSVTPHPPHHVLRSAGRAPIPPPCRRPA